MKTTVVTLYTSVLVNLHQRRTAHVLYIALLLEEELTSLAFSSRVVMVMKSFVKGLFMLFFCIVYALAMFTVAKIMQYLEKRLGSTGRRLSFTSWKSLSQSGKAVKVLWDVGYREKLGLFRWCHALWLALL